MLRAWHLRNTCDPRRFLWPPQLVSKQGTTIAISALAEKTRLLDFDTVQRDISRALASAADDPEDATTAASSLIESVCRSILIELNLPLPAKKDIDGLVRAVQEPLGLSPGRMDLPTEIEGDIRQVLGGLTSVAKGIGSLRTHAGDAHGRERGYRRIDPRIARLAINSAVGLRDVFDRDLGAGATSSSAAPVSRAGRGWSDQSVIGFNVLACWPASLAVVHCLSRCWQDDCPEFAKFYTRQYGARPLCEMRSPWWGLSGKRILGHLPSYSPE